MAEEKPVHEQVQELLARWNPPPEDKAFERLLGKQPEPGDVAATAHVPMEGLENSPSSSKIDAQRMYADDGDDEDAEDVAYDDMTVADLKDEIDSRNEGRDDDDKISKSGNKDDLIARLEEDDAADEEEGASDDE